METFWLITTIWVLGFVPGVVIGFKFMEADTRKMVKDYQDYIISGEEDI